MGDARSLDRRQFALGGVLLGASALVGLAKVRGGFAAGGPEELGRAVPVRLGPYRYRTSDDIVLPERDEVSLRIYQQYLARTYTAPGLPPVTLLIAYGNSQDYMLQVHRPESCYPVAGFTLGPSRRLPLRLGSGPVIEAVELTATRLEREDLVLYWVRLGNAFPSSLWTQRALMLRYALSGRAADGVLVRISAPAGPDTRAALRRFHALLLANLAPFGRRIVLGEKGDPQDARSGLSTAST